MLGTVQEDGLTEMNLEIFQTEVEMRGRCYTVNHIICGKCHS